MRRRGKIRALLRKRRFKEARDALFELEQMKGAEKQQQELQSELDFALRASRRRRGRVFLVAFVLVVFAGFFGAWMWHTRQGVLQSLRLAEAALRSDDLESAEQLINARPWIPQHLHPDPIREAGLFNEIASVRSKDLEAKERTGLDELQAALKEGSFLRARSLASRLKAYAGRKNIVERVKQWDLVAGPLVRDSAQIMADSRSVVLEWGVDFVCWKSGGAPDAVAFVDDILRDLNSSVVEASKDNGVDGLLRHGTFLERARRLHKEAPPIATVFESRLNELRGTIRRRTKAAGLHAFRVKNYKEAYVLLTEFLRHAPRGLQESGEDAQVEAVRDAAHSLREGVGGLASPWDGQEDHAWRVYRKVAKLAPVKWKFDEFVERYEGWTRERIAVFLEHIAGDVPVRISRDLVVYRGELLFDVEELGVRSEVGEVRLLQMPGRAFGIGEDSNLANLLVRSSKPLQGTLVAYRNGREQGSVPISLQAVPGENCYRARQRSCSSSGPSSPDRLAGRYASRHTAADFHPTLR